MFFVFWVTSSLCKCRHQKQHQNNELNHTALPLDLTDEECLEGAGGVVPSQTLNKNSDCTQKLSQTTLVISQFLVLFMCFTFKLLFLTKKKQKVSKVHPSPISYLMILNYIGLALVLKMQIKAIDTPNILECFVLGSVALN